MPLPDYHIRSLTNFRKDCAKEVAWVEKLGRHVWLTKHGRVVAAVIPRYHLKAVERVMGWDYSTARARYEEDYTLFRASKLALDEIDHNPEMAMKDHLEMMRAVKRLGRD